MTRMTIRAIRRAPCPAPAFEPRRDASESRRAGGFTLLEVLVALIVLGLLLGAVYGSYRAVTSSITDLQPRMSLDQKGRFFVQRLLRQVRCCYAGRQEQADRTTPDSNEVKAESKDESPLFRGGRTLSDEVSLQYVTTSSSLNRGSNAGYLAVVRYKMDRSQRALLTCEEIYGRRSVNEDDWDWRMIVDGVSELELQYFDGAEWREEWDSNVAGGLPRAVRIKLTLESKEDGISASFTSTASIQCCTPVEMKTTVPQAAGAAADQAR